MKQPFTRPRADRICTQVYGGPQQAAITGTFRGRRVLENLAMNDGCQIARFRQLSFLVPGFSAAGGANS